MRVAFWSEYARGACGVIAGFGLALTIAGCSSGVSRFDFPSLNLADNESSGADMSTTASLPVPSASVYNDSRYQYYGDRSSVPPQATANYSPGQARYYGSPQTARPPAPPPVLRSASTRPSSR